MAHLNAVGRGIESGEGQLNIEKIKTCPNYYRLKVGDFRVIYYPLTAERVVVLLVRNRKDAYKGLNTLDGRLERALMTIHDAAVVRIAVGGL